MTKHIHNMKLKSIFCYRSNIAILIITVLMLINAKYMKQGVIYAIDLLLSNILPTLFPFFILSDLWSAYIVIDKNSYMAKFFEKLFHINGIAISSYICGLICGFPLGVKNAVEMYKNNSITKKETEVLIGFSNNPSLAFVIFGVGAGLYKSTKVGILLFFSIIISSFIIALLFRYKTVELSLSDVNSKQYYSLVDSIKNSGVYAINISAFIIAFSSIIFSIRSMLNFNILSIIISSVLEISNSVSIIASDPTIHYNTKLYLTAFTLGFSGICVHLQTFSLLPKEISKKKYLIMKVLQGVICSIIFSLFFKIKNG